MRGLGLIVLVAALLIVAFLTLQNLKKKSPTDFQKETGMSAPANITELPSQVRNKVNEVLKKGEENNKKAMEGVE